MCAAPSPYSCISSLQEITPSPGFKLDLQTKQFATAKASEPLK